MEPTVCQLSPVSLLRLTAVDTGPVPEVESSIARLMKFPEASATMARPRQGAGASTVCQVDRAKVVVSGASSRAVPRMRRFNCFIMILSNCCYRLQRVKPAEEAEPYKKMR